MREGWISSTVADVCEVFTDGNWIESKDQSPDGIRLVQTGNIGNGFFKNRLDKSRYISQDTFDRLKCFEIFAKDCLISRLPDPVGRACLIPDIGDRMITAVDCSVLRFKQNQIIPEFFNYYSQSANYLRAVDSVCSGATRKRISRKNLGKVQINLPPLTEQKRIVAALDESFARIEVAFVSAEKNLANARELFETTLNATFAQKGEGWMEMTLKEVSLDFGRGKSKHRPRNAPFLYGGPYPFIQTGDVRNSEHYINESKQSYSEAGLAQSKLWPKGTICITIAANIAETGILGFDSCFPDSVIGIVVDEQKTSNDYVEYALQSVKARLKARGQGSAQDNINLATFETEYFPFSSLKHQQSMVDKLDILSARTQRLESIYQQKIVALKELKQSLLQKAFAGELTASMAEARVTEAVA